MLPIRGVYVYMVNGWLILFDRVVYVLHGVIIGCL